jgi:hypothetical protein
MPRPAQECTQQAWKSREEPSFEQYLCSGRRCVGGVALVWGRSRCAGRGRGGWGGVGCMCDSPGCGAGRCVLCGGDLGGLSIDWMGRSLLVVLLWLLLWNRLSGLLLTLLGVHVAKRRRSPAAAGKCKLVRIYAEASTSLTYLAMSCFSNSDSFRPFSPRACTEQHDAIRAMRNRFGFIVGMWGCASHLSRYKHLYFISAFCCEQVWLLLQDKRAKAQYIVHSTGQAHSQSIQRWSRLINIGDWPYACTLALMARKCLATALS